MNNQTTDNQMKQSEKKLKQREFEMVNKMNECEYETTGKMTNNN